MRDLRLINAKPTQNAAQGRPISNIGRVCQRQGDPSRKGAAADDCTLGGRRYFCFAEGVHEAADAQIPKVDRPHQGDGCFDKRYLEKHTRTRQPQDGPCRIANQRADLDRQGGVVPAGDTAPDRLRKNNARRSAE